MRLLLDEHYSPEIARSLRERGHDVVAAIDAGLGGVGDEELLEAAAEQRRALLTNNARHFAPLSARWAAQGRAHWGLVLTSDASMPRGTETIGRYVSALDALLREGDEDALRDETHWLTPPASR